MIPILGRVTLELGLLLALRRLHQPHECVVERLSEGSRHTVLSLVVGSLRGLERRYSLAHALFAGSLLFIHSSDRLGNLLFEVRELLT